MALPSHKPRCSSISDAIEMLRPYKTSLRCVTSVYMPDSGVCSTEHEESGGTNAPFLARTISCVPGLRYLRPLFSSLLLSSLHPLAKETPQS
ncbi:hypothetical protein TgHK011_008965 [Trichoderma gracile]|nr:hypothetical protein TgHK011_008965 [Trichoderma gracile]